MRTPTIEEIRVGLRLRHVYLGHADAYRKYGTVRAVSGHNWCIEWDDAALNSTGRGMNFWNRLDFFVLTSPEEELRQKDIAQREAYADRYL